MARPTLFTNRKFIKLAQRLESRALALGHLELLWHAANESGNPTIGDANDVELLAHWNGEPGALVRALMEAGSGGGVGFIEQRDDGLFEIHDYWHHAPEYASDRRGREDERQTPKDCNECHRDYFSADPRSEYCSSACRQRAYRERKRVTDGDGPLRTPPSGPRDRLRVTEDPSRNGVDPSRNEGSETAGVTDAFHKIRNNVTDERQAENQNRYGSVTALRNVTDRYSTPAPAPAPTTEEKKPPTPLGRGPGSLTRSGRKPRDVRAASNAAWAHVTEGATRSYRRKEIEAADPVLAKAVGRCGGWNRFGHSTAIGTLKAPFREAYEDVLESDLARAASA